MNRISLTEQGQQIDEIELLEKQVLLNTLFNNHKLSSFSCSTFKKNLTKIIDWDTTFIEKLNFSLAKLLYFICYEIYCLKERSDTSTKQLLMINNNIEYYARKLRFFGVALKTCFDIGELRVKSRNFQ